MNFGESANFPLLLGGIVTLCGLATLGATRTRPGRVLRAG